jgi:hypothetical protein
MGRCYCRKIKGIRSGLICMDELAGGAKWVSGGSGFQWSTLSQREGGKRKGASGECGPGHRLGQVWAEWPTCFLGLQAWLGQIG